MATIASELVEESENTLDAKRAVLYLSMLSCEIALKAFLQRADRPVTEIRKRSHNLKQLLIDVGECEVEVETVSNTRRWVRATGIRAVTVDHRFPAETVGKLLQAEDQGASKYPNEIRYGESLIHYPPELVAKLSLCTCGWVTAHWEVVRAK